MRWTLNLCVVPGLVATLTLSPTAFADDAIDLDAVEAPTSSDVKSATLMVPPFEGARAKKIRARFVTALESGGMQLVPQSAAGRTKLGADPSKYVSVARSTGVKAFVNGKVKLTQKSWTLTLEVRSGANGNVVGSDTISSGWLPGLLKAIDKDAKRKVEKLLSNAPEGDATAAEKVELEAPADEKAPTTDPATADPSLTATEAPREDDRPLANQVPIPLVLSVGGGLISRDLSYSDAYLDTLRQPLYPHNIALLGIDLAAAWYPGAHISDGVLANIGLNARFIRSLQGTTNVGADKVPTQAGAPPSYSTVFQELDLGVRGRIPMGTWEMGLNVGWGKQQLGLEGDNALVRLPYTESDENYPGVVPDIDIEYYRFGADIGFGLFDWSWVIGAGFRTPFYAREPGQIANERWFPNIIGTTATAKLGVNIPLFSGLGLAINADFRQTGMDMNTTPQAIVPVNNDDPAQNNLRNSIAGGAKDRHILLMAGFTWSFGSSTSAATEEDSPGDDGDSGSGDESNEETEEIEAEAAPEERASGESDTSDPGFFGKPNAKKPSSSSAGQSSKDTSNPSFFGETTASGKTAPKAKSQQSSQDTSNPDFFK
jgi:hypothetical protein